MANSFWQLIDTEARLETPKLSVAINLTRPDRGLRICGRSEEAQFNLNVLGIAHVASPRFELGKLDAYARGSDLVAVYDDSLPDSLRAQAYWRLVEPHDFFPEQLDNILAAFELILSVNTSLLDSDPQFVVHSSTDAASELVDLPVPSDRASAQTAEPRSVVESVGAKKLSNAAVVRLGDKLSYIELVHPLGACHSWATEATNERGMQLNHLLFRQRLEKGVILRARVRAAIVEGRQDQELALGAYRRFTASEPPLTV
jgi:hypothetical protein